MKTSVHKHVCRGKRPSATLVVADEHGGDPNPCVVIKEEREEQIASPVTGELVAVDVVLIGV